MAVLSSGFHSKRSVFTKQTPAIFIPRHEKAPPTGPMFQFRVKCHHRGNDEAVEHDVQAACEDDARMFAQRRSYGRIISVKKLGEVRR